MKLVSILLGSTIKSRSENLCLSIAVNAYHTGSLVALNTLNVLEPQTSIICTCIPTIYGLIGRLRKPQTDLDAQKSMIRGGHEGFELSGSSHDGQQNRSGLGYIDTESGRTASEDQIENNSDGFLRNGAMATMRPEGDFPSVGMPDILSTRAKHERF